jgi:sugar phosphate isomerase/epimerase
VPVGWPVECAVEQVIAFLALCADASDQTGVTVVVEPLCRKECNLINTVVQGSEIVRTLGRSGIRLLADTYHMEAEDEPLSVIEAHCDIIAHVHTADTGRFEPGAGSFDYKALFRTLRQAGYDNRLSIESSWTKMTGENLAKAHRKLSEAFAGVS